MPCLFFHLNMLGLFYCFWAAYSSQKPNFCHLLTFSAYAVPVLIRQGLMPARLIGRREYTCWNIRGLHFSKRFNFPPARLRAFIDYACYYTLNDSHHASPAAPLYLHGGFRVLITLPLPPNITSAKRTDTRVEGGRGVSAERY